MKYEVRIIKPSGSVRGVDVQWVEFQELHYALTYAQKWAQDLRVTVDLYVDGQYKQHFWPMGRF